MSISHHLWVVLVGTPAVQVWDHNQKKVLRERNHVDLEPPLATGRVRYTFIFIVYQRP